MIDGFNEVAEATKGSVRGVVADDEAYVLTGPYMFAKYDPQRHVILERNPAFKQWTEDTPAGHADRIQVDFKVSPDNAITRIMQGKADGASTAIPRAMLLFLEESKEWSPYLHYHEESRTSYIWMNTRVAPFDNVKVRQAVNWAINRRAMVKIGGGAGTPSSQILPPSIAGHTGVDVYPEQDMKKAKQLIAESGITPGEVTIWCFTTPPSPDSAQYLQEVLNQATRRRRRRSASAAGARTTPRVRPSSTRCCTARRSIRTAPRTSRSTVARTRRSSA